MLSFCLLTFLAVVSAAGLTSTSERVAVTKKKSPQKETITYSFQGIKFAFRAKRLKRHMANKKVLKPSTFERHILDSFPKSLRKRAAPYLRTILSMAQKYKVDPFWVLSLIWTESHFNQYAVSRVGASGVMQLMPRTRRYLLKKLRRKKVPMEYRRFKNKAFRRQVRDIELGVFYLKWLLERFGANHIHATVAYNMGPGWTVKRLRRRKSVGVRNLYLNKIKRRYYGITSQFSSKSVAQASKGKKGLKRL